LIIDYEALFSRYFHEFVTPFSLPAPPPAQSTMLFVAYFASYFFVAAACRYAR